MCSVQGSILPTFYAQLLHAQIPKAQQIHLHLSCLSLFALLGFEHVKAAYKTLMELTPAIEKKVKELKVEFLK